MEGKLRNMTSIYLSKKGKMLLLYRQGGRVVNNVWVGSAGGHFEERELNDPEACVMRELKEELGLGKDNIANLSLRYITLRKTGGEIRQNYYYFAELTDETDEHLVSNEGVSRWFDDSELLTLEMPFTAKFVIEHYLKTGRSTNAVYAGVGDGEKVVFIEMPESVKLIEPTMEYKEEIQAFRQEFLTAGGSMDGCGSLRRCDNIQDWIHQVESMKKVETTPPNLVPMTQYIYVRESDRKIVGVIQIRHYFNEYLEKYAGHIGYSVCPSERKKGYAAQMLKSVLPECKALGIDRVLICCLQENEGSRRTILKNGGKYESTVYLPEKDIYLERYWIDLFQSKC